MEVPTITYVKAMSLLHSVREYPHNMWPYMVQYLHFRILKFPLNHISHYEPLLLTINHHISPSPPLMFSIYWPMKSQTDKDRGASLCVLVPQGHLESSRQACEAIPRHRVSIRRFPIYGGTPSSLDGLFHGTSYL